MKNMKKAVLILSFMIFAGVSFGQPPQDKDERTFKGLFTAGLNLAQIDGDGPAGYGYFGAHVGAGTMVYVHKNIGLSLEMLYTMKGSIERRKEGIPQSVFTSAMDYLQVPLMLNLDDRQNILFSVGIAPGVLVRNHLKFEEYNSSGDIISFDAPDCLTNEPSAFDLSAVVGLQFVLKRRYAIGGRFSYSITELRGPCEGLTRASAMRHNVITFRFTYIL